jgi:N-acetylmuramoyl-L-alanine amidase
MAQKRKPSKKKKPAAKRPRRKKRVKQRIQPVEEVLFRVEGKMSTFGGPKDTGMSADEGLALFTQADLQDPKYSYLFLPTPPPGTTGLGRRLNPEKYYFACRWNYNDTPKEFLKRALARVENPLNGRTADARPVDWGPHISTGRVADLSPGLATALGLQTDDVVRITISALRALPVKSAKRTKQAAPASRTAPAGKPAIKQFIRSPNCSSRQIGTKIDKIVLHCTEGSLAGTLAEFQRTDKRKVSAHYVIDRNGDIYQMVNDADCANHCRGANAASIGIEHVGSETDSLAAPQAAASAALIRWLVQEYQIPRANIFGHNFTPGYNLPGGTSCPDKLFGSVHSQATIAAWVAANV